jgi:hypothetical protein
MLVFEKDELVIHFSCNFAKKNKIKILYFTSQQANFCFNFQDDATQHTLHLSCMHLFIILFYF